MENTDVECRRKMKIESTDEKRNVAVKVEVMPEGGDQRQYRREKGKVVIKVEGRPESRGETGYNTETKKGRRL